MTNAQQAAIEIALQDFEAAVAVTHTGDYIVGVCFAANETVPTGGEAYPTALWSGVGEFARSRLAAIHEGVTPVERIPLEHRKEEQQ